MRKYPTADIAGVFRKLMTDDWLIRSYGGGMRYMRDSILFQSSVSEPIYSYGKNYNKFDKDFSLFMWTTDKNKEKVSAYFNDVINDLTEDQITKITNKKDRFLYVDRKYK